jgi:cytoskeletal protein CcmA (bactofilin family)
MGSQNLSDLKIYGKGSAAGGTFNAVKIAGDGKIVGDIVCSIFRIHGDAKIEGNIKTDDGVVNGKSVVKGNLETNSFKVNGFSEVGGNLSAKITKISGELLIKGNFIAETIDIRGSLKVEKDCNTEVFNSKGGFVINGLLNAGNIEIDLYAPCKVKEIGGEKISVKRGNVFSLRSIINSIFPSFNLNDDLTVEIIEGDEIYLEWTKAKIVRGNNINIGPGCEIELVEYKNDLQMDKNAKVNNNNKI